MKTELNGFNSNEYRIHERSRKTPSAHPTSVPRLYVSPEDYEHKLHEMQKKLSKLHDALYAERRQSLLLIFQGMDTAGKDSAIKHVMSGLNPQGVTVAAFSRPSEEDLDHDFLWRTHKRLPPRGRIGIFNRSYYEEVLTVRIHRETLERERLPESLMKFPDIWKGRFHDIANHESYLSRQGTRVVKFYLHLSREEQKRRLLARIENPDKNWKFDLSDIEERKLWSRHRKAIDECILATASVTAPWYVIPADDKRNARLMICKIVLENLREMDPRYPKVSADRLRALKKIERELKR